MDDPMYMRWSTRHPTVGETMKMVDASVIYFSGGPTWSVEKMSHLIESILSGFPLPPIYVHQDGKGDWRVLDGVERLIALRCFLGGGFPLTNMTVFPEMEGRWKGDMKHGDMRGLLRATLDFHVLDALTSKEGLEFVKKRLQE